MWLSKALGLAEADAPFPWQQELFRRFTQGKIERTLDIPTGLGKTAVMALWLVARACGAKLPRRLVYVVDRRAVVDQATDVAQFLRTCVEHDEVLKRALALPTNRSLPISTLRGQHVDNRDWLEDPASVAIIVGTVDMVGSRLFFEGYGTTRKMRPYHAGLLGADTLVVLDEAHLVPPFEKLLEAVAEGGVAFAPKDKNLRKLIPSFKLMSLSATGRVTQHAPFGLTGADLRGGTVVRKRLDAPKRLTLHPLGDERKLEDVLADHAWSLTRNGTDPVRCIVFTDQRRVAEATKQAIDNLAKDDDVQTELLVGGRRVREREDAARNLAALGFIAGSAIVRTRPVFLIATSAGEVGVDIDADQMVADLVAWERMVQRLGRVNRRGDGSANVDVVVESSPTDAFEAQEKRRANKDLSPKEKETLDVLDRREAVRKLIESLPQLENGARDASPGALRNLKLDADEALLEIFHTATTPAPLRPALSRALVDAWSMTSQRKHTGRPELSPWLRGWNEDRPQTRVAWRTHLPVRTSGLAPKNSEVEAFFEAAPPHASELLETETYRVEAWLEARAKALRATVAGPIQDEKDRENAPLRANTVVAIVLDGSGDLRDMFRLDQLAPEEHDKAASEVRKKQLNRALVDGTVVVDSRLGGLSSGLLDNRTNDHPRTVDDGEAWMSAPTGSPTRTASAPVVRFRVRSVDVEQPLAPDDRWRERHRFAAELNEDGDAKRWLIVDKWRHDAATEDDRSAGRPQLLVDHHQWAEDRARHIASRLGLPETYSRMLRLAARLHDEGKRAPRWQRAFNAPKGGAYAKTLGPVCTALLDGYRHEFGSLLYAAQDPEICELSDELRDLALHLIAAHHGFARPVIATSGCEDAPPSALEQRAREVALRFARLQNQWGPWGLAWWEALLRAADQQASRDNDAAGATSPRGSS